MIIFSNQLTPRLQYIVSTLLPAAGIALWRLTDNTEVYLAADLPKINYSSTRLASAEIHVEPNGLLFQKTVEPQEITISHWQNLPVFFQTPSADLPFDLFAAAFYLITRYEEYLPYQKDEYGRYAYEQSLACKQGFLHLPLVNLWLQQFAAVLKDRFPSVVLTPPVFHFMPTYDIDIAYSYRHKGWKRNIGGLCQSLLENEWQRVSERLNVLFGGHQDPFDSYDWLDQLHARYNVYPVYFFLLAQRNKGYDKHILPAKPALQKLVKRLHARYKTGLHPSWQSGDEHAMLTKEIDTLKKLTGEKVSRSRQHYIRMTLPGTYRNLIQHSISEEFSMGYGSINGFRASYCLPHSWYDLGHEETTALTIYPFCFMDANSYYEQHHNTHATLQELKHYVEITRQVNGMLVTIWHNHFLGTDTMFKGWREVYEQFAEYVSG